jgi:putative membrane protein insertion efficiency factor
MKPSASGLEVQDADSSGDGGSGRPASPLIRVFRLCTRIPGLIAVLIVRVYQWTLSPLLGRTCRFHPSCSEYFIQATARYGLVRALWKGTRRICRCHPWNPGGYDPP